MEGGGATGYPLGSMAAHSFLRHSLFVLLACAWPAAVWADDARAMFRAGAFAVDITPEKFPVIVNGNFFPVVADKAHDRLHARWIVLDDGKGTRIGLCVVDSLMTPRELLDEAKGEIEKATGLRPDRVMISATHTHSAPSVMGCLGSDADPDYPKFLVGKLVDGARQAVKNLAPAKVGHASVQLPQYTRTRQWVYRPDRMLRDPFGELTVRANMHPGYQNAAVIGPTGPSDPELSVVSFQSAERRPIAVLANYSMHYFGAPAVSSDYFGLFCEKLARKIAPQQQPGSAPFVAIMSQGTSGDQHWMDYGAPEKKLTMDACAQALADAAHQAYQTIQFRADVDLAMGEKDLRIPVRAPDEKRLAWARDVVAKLKDGKPTTLPEVYAREAIFLHEKPFRDVKLQAIRIGPVGIAAIPCEVFALTGLKIKAQSPLEKTFTIELANGADGYIPPPELHPLGGYTTWPARTAQLEVSAEPKILDASLALLEAVGGKTRRPMYEPDIAYARAVRSAKPLAYWTMGAADGTFLSDASGNGHVGKYENGVVFYLAGPALEGDGNNRCPHFAGGRMKADLPRLGGAYSVSFWFWNGQPTDARPVTAYLFSRGPDGHKEAAGDHLGVGGTFAARGRLLFFNGNKLNTVLAGTTPIESGTWNHVALVRDGNKVTAYLNGKPDPEISGEAEPSIPPGTAQVFLGGRNDNFANLEGRIDEAAVFDRALKPDEVGKLFAAAEVKPAATSTPQGAAPKTERARR